MKYQQLMIKIKELCFSNGQVLSVAVCADPRERLIRIYPPGSESDEDSLMLCLSTLRVYSDEESNDILNRISIFNVIGV